jgi:hypothetical protein
LLTTVLRLQTTGAERRLADDIDLQQKYIREHTVRRFPQLALAIGLVISATHAHAQSNSTPRPSTDSSVTTGIGSTSTFKNVPPPDLPVARTPGAVILPMPETQEKKPDENAGKETRETGNLSPPPAAEVKEDPRTMITRDRIESPQH